MKILSFNYFFGTIGSIFIVNIILAVMGFSGYLITGAIDLEVYKRLYLGINFLLFTTYIVITLSFFCYSLKEKLIKKQKAEVSKRCFG